MSHRGFVVVVVAGVGVRVIAMIAYRPALWYNDAFEYVGVDRRFTPYLIRPSGYSGLLRLFQPFHSFALVVGVQHLLGVGLGVLVYATLRRLGLRQWLATAAAVPVLLDPDIVQLEHLVLSDTLFMFLLAAATLVVVWSPQPSPRACLGAGLLLAAAALTRSVGLPFVLLTAGYLLAKRVGWRGPVALLAAFAVPVLGYASWFDAAHGRFALTNSTGIFLYSRVTTFADCDRIHPPADERPLCLSTPIGTRGPTEGYIWHPDSPLRRVPGDTFSARKNALAGDFAHRAILAQPVDYLRAVRVDVYRSLAWRRVLFPDRTGADYYVFRGSDLVRITDRAYGTAGGSALSDTTWYEHGDAGTKVDRRLAGWLASYQRYLSLRGALIGVLLAVGALGLSARGRRPALFAPLLLVEGTAVALWLLPPMTAEFDWRFVLPVIPFAAVAAALAVERLTAAPATPPPAAKTDRQERT